MCEVLEYDPEARGRVRVSEWRAVAQQTHCVCAEMMLKQN
jgi:hypothetical protein